MGGGRGRGWSLGTDIQPLGTALEEADSLPGPIPDPSCLMAWTRSHSDPQTTPPPFASAPHWPALCLSFPICKVGLWGSLPQAEGGWVVVRCHWITIYGLLVSPHKDMPWETQT